MKQSRNWCFTDFELLEWSKLFDEYKDIIRYLCVGEEVCPKTKKKHIQGWIQFHNKKTLGGVKQAVGSRTLHLEPCMGNEYDNDKYCTKDGKYTKYGLFITQGRRSDLEAVKKLIDDGATMKNVADEYWHEYVRYRKSFESYKEMVDQKLRASFRMLKVKVISGKTGKGKTRSAMKKDTYKIEGQNLQWFDGYNGEKHLLIDDYNNDIGITKLLNLLDGYQLRLPIKGGHTYAAWDEVTITTNLKKLHKNAKREHLKALNRRITTWSKMW